MIPPPCIETLKVWQRQFPDLPDHQARFDRTRRALWPATAVIQLADILTLPNWLQPDQVYKCRVTYEAAIQKIEFEPYIARPVQTLKLIDAGNLDYSYKWADRKPLNDLFAQRGPADDILLVQNGLITDTSYANVALFNGQTWFTPDRPLLAGTQRARLIREGILTPMLISVNDLPKFVSLKLVNALLDWEMAPILPIAALM